MLKTANNMSLSEELDHFGKDIHIYDIYTTHFKQLKKRFHYQGQIGPNFFIYTALQKCLKSPNRREDIFTIFPQFLKQYCYSHVNSFFHDLVSYPSYMKDYYNIYYGFISRVRKNITVDKYEEGMNSDDAYDDTIKSILNLMLSDDRLFDKFIKSVDSLRNIHNIESELIYNLQQFNSINDIDYELIYNLHHERFMKKYNKSVSMLFNYYCIMYEYLYNSKDDEQILSKLYTSKKREQITIVNDILQKLNHCQYKQFQSKLALLDMN